MLAFMEHCRAETAGRPDAERIEPADYEMVGRETSRWAWATGSSPSRRSGTPPTTTHAISRIRRPSVPEGEVAKALTLRALVPAFLERAADQILAAGPRVVGFSMTFSQNVPALTLARMLKDRDPSLRIVFGGGNATGPWGRRCTGRSPGWTSWSAARPSSSCPTSSGTCSRATDPPRPGFCYRDGERPSAFPQSGAATSRWTRYRRRGSTSTSSGSPRSPSPRR